MASKGQMTGMAGVYLVAAELTQRGFIVSPTSRSAAGADLLVTDQACQKAWSVQVKTNRKPASFWLLGKHAAKLKSDTHVYVFVNLRKDQRPEYVVVPSVHVTEKIVIETRPNSVFYAFRKADRLFSDEGWEAVFGDPHAIPEPEIMDELASEVSD
jgi:hypothetical protein